VVNQAKRGKRLLALATGLALVGVVAFGACGGDDAEDEPADGGNTPAADASPTGTDYSSLSGSVVVDGSSTVGPVTEAVAEEFGKVSDVQVSVGISGTGGGFEKFCKGETDINDASRPVKDSEKEACAAAGIGFIELKVGVDGLTVVTNPDNDFVECLTWSQLRKIWDTGSTVKNWSDVDPGFPAEEIKLFGPGPDSGTFDFFTEEINGKTDQSRSDFTASEDDNVLSQGVQNDKNALGYFGYAYFKEAGDKLKAVQIDKDQDSKGAPVPAEKRKGCLAPTDSSINDGSYSLSRPLFIYVSKAALEKPQIRGFVEYYLENAKALVTDVGYIPLSDAAYATGMDTLNAN